MKRVELVFRTVGERTSDLALELAIEAIKPDAVHVIRDVKPFREAVRRMLELPHECDTVVHMDADCLILEDMRPFLEWNDHPYVDCYVHDRFRGHIHCGVHIVRRDVVDEMRTIEPPDDDLAFVLRPESRLRNLALAKFGQMKRFCGFRILHDHHQSYLSIWEKYALRELRSRTEHQLARLEGAMKEWGDTLDHQVARDAIDATRERVPEDASVADVDAYICALPEHAAQAIERLGLTAQPPLTREEIMDNAETVRFPEAPFKVFGLGLSRTGTRSLTAALHVLGFHTVHYPTDAQTLRDLERGDGRFALLDHYDGLTDITASPYYESLDRQYPGSKFVLTVRDPESWLQSAANHWSRRPAHDDPKKDETHLRIRRLLRAATYGCYDFEPDRFRFVQAEHERAVRHYFRDRPEDLLVLKLTDGAGWQPLCEFLGVDLPGEPFPHKGGKLSADMRRLEVDD